MPDATPQPVPNMRIWCASCKAFQQYTEPTPGQYACETCQWHCAGFKPIKWPGPRDRGKVGW